MRFILRKYDVYLKEGEEPKDCIGFKIQGDEYWRPDEVRAKK